MDIVKAIKENPHCVASITVKVKGRDNIKENKSQKVYSTRQKPQVNSC